MKAILTHRSVFPFHRSEDVRCGGGNKYVYGLARNLVKEGVDVEIITSLDRNFHGKEKTYDGINYTFIYPNVNWRKKKAPWNVLFSLNIPRYLRKKEFDVLHTYEISSYFYLHKKKRKPVIAQPFGFEPFMDPKTHEMRKSLFKRTYIDLLLRHTYRYCLTHADKVALEGTFQHDIAEELSLKREKLFVLPVAIDIGLMKQRLEKSDISRKDLDIGDDDFVLISVTRLDPNKGLDYLIKAFALLKKEVPDAKLIFVGKGPEEHNFLNDLRKFGLMDDVRHLKDVPEDSLYSYYDLADVYVSPTLQEDFMMSILEGMASGLPVISTGQEFLVEHGANGYVVEKENPEAMAERMIELADKKDLRKKMSAESLRAVEKFDSRNVAKVAIRNYEELING